MNAKNASAVMCVTVIRVHAHVTDAVINTPIHAHVAGSVFVNVTAAAAVAWMIANVSKAVVQKQIAHARIIARAVAKV